MTTRKYDLHLAAIKTGTIEGETVRGIRKLLNASERKARGYSIGRTSATCTPDEMATLLETLAEVRPLVVGELADTGKAQLTKRRYARQLASMSEIVADLQSFRLIGFETIGRNLDQYTPVYRAYNTAGKSFPFINIPWQSGGKGPEIMSPNYW